MKPNCYGPRSRSNNYLTRGGTLFLTGRYGGNETSPTGFKMFDGSFICEGPIPPYWNNIGGSAGSYQNLGIFCKYGTNRNYRIELDFNGVKKVPGMLFQRVTEEGGRLIFKIEQLPHKFPSHIEREL